MLRLLREAELDDLVSKGFYELPEPRIKDERREAV